MLECASRVGWSWRASEHVLHSRREQVVVPVISALVLCVKSRDVVLRESPCPASECSLSPIQPQCTPIRPRYLRYDRNNQI